MNPATPNAAQFARNEASSWRDFRRRSYFRSSDDYAFVILVLKLLSYIWSCIVSGWVVFLQLVIFAQYLFATYVQPFPIVEEKERRRDDEEGAMRGEKRTGNNKKGRSRFVRNETLPLAPIVSKTEEEDDDGAQQKSEADEGEQAATSTKSTTSSSSAPATLDEAIHDASRLKRFLVVFAHSELNDRSVAGLRSICENNVARKLIREKFVFFAYSVLNRDTQFSPGFLTSCRSLPALGVFGVRLGPSSQHQQQQHGGDRSGVTLLATLEGAATCGSICLFLQRCLETYSAV